MTLFQELDLTTFSGGLVTTVSRDGLAHEIGLRPGDRLLAINDHAVEDVIDVQFYGAEESLELLVRRDTEYLLFEAEREYNQELGLVFDHPTFDTDIRRCNNLCEFCFVLQMAPRFRRTLYIKDDDYRYSFLFGHFVTLTNLSEHDWWRIENMGLSPLYVSVHVTDTALRRQFLRNESAPNILDQLRRLTAAGIDVHTQLVVVPEFNDGPWLQRSIDDLATLWPGVRSISVVPVGLTTHHKYRMRVHTTQEAEVTMDYVEALQARFLKRFGVRFAYLTDEWYLLTGRPLPQKEAYDGQDLVENGLGMVRRFLDEWQGVQQEIAAYLRRVKDARLEFGSVSLVTGVMFAQTLQRTADEFHQLTGIKIGVLPAINYRLGETITAAGLLMGQDVLTQLQNAPSLGELIVLPRVMFDHPDIIALDDMTPQSICDACRRPLALADSMGDVWDALTGQSKVLFTPVPPANGAA